MPFPTAEPTWQTADLTSLASAGKLGGLNPDILGAIAQEESGFENAGAGVNSSGYGGYFGLSTSQVSTSTLETNSAASFEDQAQVAAADFNRYLDETGGNVGQAESIFQTGSPTGETGGGVPLVLAAVGGPTTGVGSPATAQDDSITGAIGGAIGSSAGTAVSTGVENLFGINGGSGLATRILLVVVALILLAVGVSKLLDRSASPTDTIVEGGQNAGAAASTAKQWGNSGAASGQQVFLRHATRTSSGKHVKQPNGPRHNAGGRTRSVAKTGAKLAAATAVE